jgi:ABC-type bacteriocin/lantibiotic exporter with double-glycine peptidase domain
MKKVAQTSPWKRLSELLKLEKNDVSQLYIYALFSGLIGLSLPLGIQSVVTFIQAGQISTSWVVLVGLVILGVVLSGVLQIMQLRITETIQQRIFTRYSFDFAYRFPRMHRLIIKDANPSELMNRFFDIISLQKGIAKVLLDFTSSSLQIIFSLLVLSFYHPFFIAFSLTLIVLLYLIFRPMIRLGFETSLEESKHKYRTAFWLQEIARADWTFRLTPQGNHSLKRLDSHTSEYINSREKHFTVLWKQYSWMIAIKAIIVAALLGLGGFLVIDQQMNLGQFVAAEVLILLLLTSVEKLIQLLESLYDVFTSLEKLGSLQDIPLTFSEFDAETQHFEVFPIELISVSQPNAPLIKVNKGERLLLVGGNQELALNRLKNLIDTSVSHSHTPRWNMTIPSEKMMYEMYDRVGWFDSNSSIFDGSIRDNLTMGRTSITRTELEKALEVVQLTAFVEQHVNGYDTLVGNNSPGISQEDKERILIARALAHHPDLLLLSMHGLTLDDAEIVQLLERITNNYPASTIVCAIPAQLPVQWQTIQSLN